MSLGMFATFHNAAHQIANALKQGSRHVRPWRAKADRVPSTEARKDFFCYHFCDECKYLSEAEGSCPSCGAEGTMDLADRDTADRLRWLEDEERMQVDPVSKTLTWGLSIAGFIAGIFLGGGLCNIIFDEEPFLMVLGATTTAAILFGCVRVFLPLWLSERIRRAFSSRPWRWRHPLPLLPKKAAVQSTKGTATARSDQVTAPVTGRPCLGWRVAVLFDREGDARPAEWVLDESLMTDIRVGDTDLPGPATTLHGDYQEVEPADEEAIYRFLRSRGLFTGDGVFRFFEAILEDGAPCTLDIPESEEHGPQVNIH